MDQAVAAGPSATSASDMATEMAAAALSQATPVSGREVEGISESETDSEGEDTAPVSYSFTAKMYCRSSFDYEILNCEFF